MLRLRFVSVVCLGVVASAGLSRLAAENAVPTPVGPPPLKAVVELFTSQGCSSCPPADALLRSYADQPDIIALTMPVDYWDYLGWKDTFGSAKNSDRQRAYAKTRGDGAIYTPQVVINGVAHVNGSNAADINFEIDSQEKTFAASRVPVRFWHQRNTLIIETGGAPPGSKITEATIWLAVVQKRGEVEIRSGENKGKTLTYTNVVRELTPIGLWTGKPETLQLARIAIMRPETEAAVILLQEGQGGPIIGATWAGLW